MQSEFIDLAQALLQAIEANYLNPANRGRLFTASEQLARFQPGAALPVGLLRSASTVTDSLHADTRSSPGKSSQVGRGDLPDSARTVPPTSTQKNSYLKDCIASLEDHIIDAIAPLSQASQDANTSNTSLSERIASAVKAAVPSTSFEAWQPVFSEVLGRLGIHLHKSTLTYFKEAGLKESAQLERVIENLFGSISFFQGFTALNSVYAATDWTPMEPVTYTVRAVATPRQFSHLTNRPLTVKTSLRSTVVIGKQLGDAFCDFPLPQEDSRADFAQVALIHQTWRGQPGPFLVDISSKGRIALCLRPIDGEVPLSQGMIVQFGVITCLEVTGIDGNQVQLLHMTGPSQGLKCVLERHKTEYIVGRGGRRTDPESQLAIVNPDVKLPVESKASIEHAVIRASENGWFLRDKHSTNGTFVFLKTAEELRSKQPSQPVSLFGRFCPSMTDSVFIVGSYKFYAKKGDTT